MTTRLKNFRNTYCLACFVTVCLSATRPMAAEPPGNSAMPKPTGVTPNTLSTGKASTEVHSVSTDMVPIMTLLLNHDKIHFTIENIPHGERTTTTSQDPEIEKEIRTHAREMKARVQQGNVIRPNDPIFAEIFRRHKEIRDAITDIPGGVSEDETSRSPQVVLLIRAHAQAVSGFVRQGLAATRGNTPLPKGYHSGAGGRLPVR